MANTDLMQYRDAVIRKELDISPNTHEWLQRNYTKYKQHWKDTKVVELIEREVAMNGVKSTNQPGSE